MNNDDEFQQHLSSSLRADWSFTLFSAASLLTLGAGCGLLVARGYMEMAHARIFLLGLCGGCMAASLGASPLRNGLRGLGIIALVEVVVICVGSFAGSLLGFG
jgi:hypothetical protein